MPQGIFVWSGVYSLTETPKIWASNFSDEPYTIPLNTTIAWSLPSDISPGEIHSADEMLSSLLETRSREARRISHLLTLTPPRTPSQDVEAADDSFWWQDDHLELDLSQVPRGLPDPPAEASAQQLIEMRAKELESLRRFAKKSGTAPCE